MIEGMVSGRVAEWDGVIVRAWLESRIAAARADQVAAERGGWERRDDCDMAAAEEMVCTLMKRGDAVDTQKAFVDALKALLGRDDFVWRGVYDDNRFDRHVRAHIRKLTKMGRANDGFANVRRYQ